MLWSSLQGCIVYRALKSTHYPDRWGIYFILFLFFCLSLQQLEYLTEFLGLLAAEFVHKRSMEYLKCDIIFSSLNSERKEVEVEESKVILVSKVFAMKDLRISSFCSIEWM